MYYKNIFLDQVANSNVSGNRQVMGNKASGMERFLAKCSDKACLQAFSSSPASPTPPVLPPPSLGPILLGQGLSIGATKWCSLGGPFLPPVEAAAPLL